MNTRHLRPADLAGMRWRGLVRESTEAQAEKWSPERQRADLRRAADDLGLVPAKPLWYERTGSGETEHAPEITDAIAGGRRKEYDVLLVLHTSRLARNRSEAIRVKQEAMKAGIVLYFVAQRLISGSRADQLMEGIFEVLDEHGNEERRFWIAGGIRERMLSGRWTGNVPIGYKRVMADRPDGSRGPDGSLEPDPVLAPIVARIFAESSQGRTGREIAEGLGSAGGRAWTKRIVNQILDNPIYTGTMIRYRRPDRDHYYRHDDPNDGRRVIPMRVPALV